MRDWGGRGGKRKRKSKQVSEQNRSQCCKNYAECLWWRSMQWGQTKSEWKTFARIKKANRCQRWPGLCIITRGGWGEVYYVNTENKNWLDSLHTRPPWALPKHEATWRTAASPGQRVCSGCPSHMGAHRCSSSWMLTVCMLTLSAGIRLQRPDWKSFHYLQRGKNLPLQLLLACKVKHIQFSQECHLTYIRVIRKKIPERIHDSYFLKMEISFSTPFLRSYTCPRHSQSRNWKVIFLLTCNAAACLGDTEVFVSWHYQQLKISHTKYLHLKIRK